jgi:hypothetical protein
MLHEVVPEGIQRELSASVLEDNMRSDQILRSEPMQARQSRHTAPQGGARVAAHCLIFASVTLPVIVLVLLLSVMGFGDMSYIGLAAWEWPWYAAAAVDVMLVAMLWLLDVTSWRHPALVAVRHACVVVFVVVAGITCLLATKVHPLMPLLFGLLLIPACVVAVRHSLVRALEPPAYMYTLSLSMGVTAAILFIYFVLWVFVLPPPPRRINLGWDPSWQNFWGGPVKEYWRMRLACTPFNATAVENDVDCYDAAFLWWVFPLLMAMALTLASAACGFLGRVVASEGGTAEAGAVKLFLIVVALAAVGMYFAASIAGAGMGLSDFVVHGVVFILASAIVTVGVTLGWAKFMQTVAELPVVQRARSYVQSMHEWCVAVVLCVGITPISLYLLASALKQLARRARRARRLQHPGRPTPGLLTAEAAARLKSLESVHWGSVCAKVTILNLAYLTLSIIVAKVVVVFLSGLTLWLAPVPLFAILLIFLLIGLAMFLIPVIPGVPVYICAGVLIPSAMMTPEERADTTTSAAPTNFWIGLMVACALASLLKFVAIVVQQEGIGKRLGRNIGVRAACQINSTFIRAARFVLTQDGCTFGKTMILCGGPDWPTSVLTGILRLSVVKMLLGSLPVVVIIFPCTVLGASLLMVKRPGWESASEFFTLLAGGSQLAASVGFAAVIERASITHAAAIAALPYDEEVRALDERSAEYSRAWREVSDWRDERHPGLARCMLGAAAALSTVGCHLATLLRCFARVTVADPFDGAPLHGNPLNVVNGLQGWLVIECFVAASLLLYVHHKWLAGLARRRPPRPLPGTPPPERAPPTRSPARSQEQVEDAGL